MHDFQVRQLWTWANQAHIAAQYVEELRKFVKLVLAEEASESRYAGITFFGQRWPIVLGVDRHGSELVYGKQNSVSADPFQAENDRAGRFVADEHGSEHQQGPEEQKGQYGEG